MMRRADQNIVSPLREGLTRCELASDLASSSMPQPNRLPTRRLTIDSPVSTNLSTHSDP